MYKKSKKPKRRPPLKQAIISISDGFVPKRLPSIEAVESSGPGLPRTSWMQRRLREFAKCLWSSKALAVWGRENSIYGICGLLYGDLGAFSQSWLYWHVDRDALISPEGERITQESVLLIPTMREQIAALLAELEKYKAQPEDDQPAPPDEVPTIHPRNPPSLRCQAVSRTSSRVAFEDRYRSADYLAYANW